MNATLAPARPAALSGSTPRAGAPGASRRRARPAHGLGAVSVLLVLVGLAAMAAAVLRLGQQDQGRTAQDLDGARAAAAARTGIEWGLYQAFKGSWTSCSDLSRTLDHGDGLRITVRCDSRSFNEGETSPGVPRVLRVFTIDAVACSSSGSTQACPDAASAAGSRYVEHRQQVQAVN